MRRRWNKTNGIRPRTSEATTTTTTITPPRRQEDLRSKACSLIAKRAREQNKTYSPPIGSSSVPISRVCAAPSKSFPPTLAAAACNRAIVVVLRCEDAPGLLTWLSLSKLLLVPIALRFRIFPPALIPRECGNFLGCALAFTESAPQGAKRK